MPLEVVAVAYGAPALDELARRVASAKERDVLAPVTVVVPSNYVGVAARRRLAREHGLIGVTFLTVYRLAELLGAATLAFADAFRRLIEFTGGCVGMDGQQIRYQRLDGLVHGRTDAVFEHDVSL